MTAEKPDDPLLPLFAEWQWLREERAGETPEAWMAEGGKRCVAVERDMTHLAPLSAEGAAALVTVMIYWAKHGGPSEGEQERMLSNLLIWIERAA